ncbi:serine hydroxymethyltransferase domain protein, partial [Mycobacterium xenopi 4042]
GGTDNHIVLLDVTSFGLTGRRPNRRYWTPASSPTATPFPQIQRRVVHQRHPVRHPCADHPRLWAGRLRPVAELVTDVLTNTTPQGSSKAKYTLADGTASGCARGRRAAGANPLYPGLAL